MGSPLRSCAVRMVAVEYFWTKSQVQYGLTAVLVSSDAREPLIWEQLTSWEQAAAYSYLSTVRSVCWSSCAELRNIEGSSCAPMHERALECSDVIIYVLRTY